MAKKLILQVLLISFIFLLFIVLLFLKIHQDKNPTRVQPSKINSRCRLLPKQGTCQALIPKYYYDDTEKICTKFYWGGCEGVVPFHTLKDCMLVCENNIYNDVCQKIHDLNIKETTSISRKLCERCDGSWDLGSQPEGCNPSVSDFRKVCNDNSECEGKCIEVITNPNTVKGMCSQFKFVFGCNREVINGKVQEICRDD